CVGTNEPDLQTALTMAQGTTSVSDTVQVGNPGPGATGYMYTDGGNSANEVNVIGAGAASTILTRSGPGVVIRIDATGSNLSHLTVQLPAADATGISTSGSLDDVNITTLDPANQTQLGI